MKIGKYNTLRCARFTDHGAYLTDDAPEPAEVLLPNKYVPDDLAVGDELDVFVYVDFEGRPVATTEHPYATVGEFAFLEVVDVNDTGAFMDWGVLKQLLVPYSEQKFKMRTGGVYPVYIYLDDASRRIVGSSRLEKFVGNVPADYRRGQKVQALVVGHNERGYKCIVDNLHFGFLYENEVYRPLELGESTEAFVRKVREDGKIDLSLQDRAAVRTDALSHRILQYLRRNRHSEAAFSENLSPEEIKVRFSCSKKDFKKAVGALYKDRKIAIDRATGIITIRGCLKINVNGFEPDF